MYSSVNEMTIRLYDKHGYPTERGLIALAQIVGGVYSPKLFGILLESRNGLQPVLDFKNGAWAITYYGLMPEHEKALMIAQGSYCSQVQHKHKKEDVPALRLWLESLQKMLERMENEEDSDA